MFVVLSQSEINNSINITNAFYKFASFLVLPLDCQVKIQKWLSARFFCLATKL